MIKIVKEDAKIFQVTNGVIQIELMGEREGNLILKLPKNKEIIESKFNYSKINISENI